MDSSMKMNGKYYCSVLLSQQMLSPIKSVHHPAGQLLAYCSHETVQLLQSKTP